MTPEEIKAGGQFPRNGGRAPMTDEQARAMANYWRVRGDPKREQAAVLELAKLGLAPGVSNG